MTSHLKNIAKMQMMLAEMEVAVGIRELGAIEKSVLSSIADLEEGGQFVSTKEILEHPLTQTCSRPSLFRALSSLEASGKIARLGGKRGLYALASES